MIAVINGDVILVSRKFKFSVGGFVQMFIRLFQNLVYVSTFQFRKVCIYHHAASIVIVNGHAMVYEAVDIGYISAGLFSDYIKDKTLHKYIIRRCKFDIDNRAYNKSQVDMLGKDYWFWGTLFLQLIKQLTLDWVWIGSSHKKFDKVYCSQAVARSLFYATEGECFQRWWTIDPQDIYVSKHLITI